MAWLGAWSKRIKLTIDHGDIDDALSDFPILVYLSTSSGRNSKDVSCVFDELAEDANRKKIAVTTSDGETQCYVEIEKWDDANEQAWLWVKVPAVASGADTILYLYYDSAHADNDAHVGDTNSTPAENVWDGNFKFVTHMQDDPDISHVRDSTNNNYDGTKKGADEPIETDGKIGKAQDFDGDDDIAIGTALNLGTADFFIEFWIKTGTDGSLVISKYESGTDRWRIQVGLWAGVGMYAEAADVASVVSLDSLTSILDNEWHYVVFLGDRGNRGWMFLDGVDDTGTRQICLANDLDNTGTLYLGKRIALTSLTGSLDEFRISNIIRSPAWIKASFESGTDDLLAFGEEERELPLVMCIGGMEGNTQAKKLGSQHISSGAIISDLIAISAVGTQHLADEAVTSGKLASGQVGIPHIYPNAIVSAKIASGQVGAPHIYPGAVTSAKIGPLAVAAPHIAANAIVSGKVASGGLSPLTSGKIWAGFTGNIAREENKPAAVPSGLIAFWHGTIANIPSGWVICDGNNNTPNLLTKFVQGVATAATDPGATGGAVGGDTDTAVGTNQKGTTSHDLTGEHDHTIADWRPPFYDVAFIMKT